MRPVAGSLCIVLVCDDPAEAAEVSRQLQIFDKGCLVTYRRAQDFLLNAPAGKVAMVILATPGEPHQIERTLQWLRHRLPRCPITVIGDSGCGHHERVARAGGACYLTRPVQADQWVGLLSHVLGEPVDTAPQSVRSHPA
jgi:FixJ family two-component response regulator